MATFKTFLTERYVNAFHADEKRKYMQQVWDILVDSYAYIGGLKGHEFKSPETMLQVPFWKLAVKDGKVLVVGMYKDHNGRKSIAFGTNGSSEGKILAKKMIEEDFSRSYIEISGAIEAFVEKHMPELFKQYRVPASEVAAIINKEITPVDKYHYKRKIGGVECTKILVGTPGKKFY
jgi:hypothetical protein